ncbi:MAG: hypothetical protein F2750_02175 [Actinobacteria bacterium]|uniref:Unannotated protein n=1 Tax=freshwater metagenome TaxID=449393 RepID=A0A6J6YNA3_9ZZZZ|nr:hypothetical protein [Actinomycetota bacterium]
MRIKLIAALSTIFLSLSLTSTAAATKSPTPTPKPTVSAKASASAKATATAKAPVKKAPVKKKKKVVKLSPSPSPKWPPVGFKTDALGETKLYLKVPSAKELVGILSAKSALASQVKACTQFTCGAVQVASETGCRWWRVNAEVIGATSAENRSPKTFGKIVADVTRSAAKQIVTILLVTTEPIGAGHIVSNINVDCNQGDPTGPIPNTDYQVIADK